MTGIKRALLAFLLLLPVPAAARIVPHRALYTMSLASVKAGSSINDVAGTMIFEWADACDGWAIQQRMHLNFSHAEGDRSAIDSTVMMWEAKDGSRYSFTVRRRLNGKDDGSFKGYAEVDEKGGSVTYTSSGDKTAETLPVGTLFPSGHTEMIVDKAKKGEMLFSRRVFDGSDEIGSSDVSAFIGKAVVSPKDEGLPENVLKSPLLEDQAWPVRLAFFVPDSETGTPDYEMDLVLQENGIARLVKIDYDDFSVKGVLSKLEGAPSLACSKK